MIFDFYKLFSTRRVITSMIYGLPLMRNQIGADLGFTVVHVNRVLRSLRDERIVNLEKHCVTIGLGGRLYCSGALYPVPTAGQSGCVEYHLLVGHAHRGDAVAGDATSSVRARMRSSALGTRLVQKRCAGREALLRIAGAYGRPREVPTRADCVILNAQPRSTADCRRLIL
jgi:hypothetical protein